MSKKSKKNELVVSEDGNIGTVELKAVTTVADPILSQLETADHQKWLETPEGIEYAAKLDAIAAAAVDIQIGQRVWKKVRSPETGFIINVCTRITKVFQHTVVSEFLYGVTGPEKTTLKAFTDADGLKWCHGFSCTIAIETLKKHVAKDTGNIWWETLSPKA